MEQPYGGRASVTEAIDTIVVEIPARKNWAMIIFLCIWLCGWVLGECFGAGMVCSLNEGFINVFALVWLCGWTLGGVMVFRKILWSIKGREIIIAGDNKLTIKRDMDLFFRPKTYDLNEVKNMRVQDVYIATRIWGRRDMGLLDAAGNGIIRFDYGFKTVKFAAGIDEAEAIYLVDQIKKKTGLK